MYETPCVRCNFPPILTRKPGVLCYHWSEHNHDPVEAPYWATRHPAAVTDISQTKHGLFKRDFANGYKIAFQWKMHILLALIENCLPNQKPFLQVFKIISKFNLTVVKVYRKYRII